MSDVVLGSVKLGFPWQTVDPFLFCAYHNDAYPAGNAQMGVEPGQLAGRNVGSDFVIKDGWRMYHGDVVPGFPSHPHRGFETIPRPPGLHRPQRSRGAKARSQGDIQWMTAGGRVIEMFLIRADRGNPTSSSRSG